LETIERANPTISEHETEALVRAAAKEFGDAVLANLSARVSTIAIDSGAERAAFETLLRDPWGPAFDALQALIVVARESSVRIVERDAGEANAGDAPRATQFGAMVRLHVRALRVAEEVFALLRAGFAGGAMARWRTLHEIAVVMAFLAERDPDVSERYVLHDTVARWRSLADYQRYAERLGETPFSAAEVEEMEQARGDLVTRFGRPFGEEWGWAAETLGVSKPRFDQIECAADLSHWRPHSRWASQNVHAGPHALFSVLGTDDPDLLLAGASNVDLEAPGANAAHSLALATVELLARQPTIEDLASMHVVMALSHEAEEAFATAADVLAERIEEE
jgi:hypothetical protein